MANKNSTQEQNKAQNTTHKMDIIIQIRIIPVRTAITLLPAMNLEAAHRTNHRISHRIIQRIVTDKFVGA